MTIYKFADVVLVGFPFTNLKTIKKRPAVVLSDETYQQSRHDVILMAVTSQIRQPPGYGEFVLSDWQQAGLLKPSVLKPLIATVEQTQVLNHMGTLSPLDQELLFTSLQTLFGQKQ